MQATISVLTVALFAFIAWLPILAALVLMRNLPRVWFVALHYGLDILLFGLVFAVYHKRLGRFSPFGTMAIAMFSLFAIEFVFWNFFYRGELWFLNFVDWIVPAFLVASTVYFAGVVFQ